MFSRLSFIFVILLSLCVPTHVFAAKNNSVDALAKVVFSEPQYKLVVNQVLDSITASMMEQFKGQVQAKGGNPLSPGAEKLQFDVTRRTIEHIFDREMKYSDFVAIFSREISAQLTPEEVEQAVGFYQTSAGKKILDWGYKVSLESIKNTPISLQDTQKSEEAFKTEMVKSAIQNFSDLTAQFTAEEMQQYIAYAVSPVSQKLAALTTDSNNGMTNAIREKFVAAVQTVNLTEEFAKAKEEVLAERKQAIE